MTKINRKLTLDSHINEPVYDVAYAPVSNITQAAIDAVTLADLTQRQRTARLTAVRDHAMEVDTQTEAPDNPGKFTVTWKNGRERDSSLRLPDGQPGPLLKEFLDPPPASKR